MLLLDVDGEVVVAALGWVVCVPAALATPAASAKAGTKTAANSFVLNVVIGFLSSKDGCRASRRKAIVGRP